MVTKPTYSASQLGGCPRSASAPRFDFEPTPRPEFLEIAAKEGTRHEDWVREDLRAEGFEITSEGYCEADDRYGEHVEMDFPAFKLQGHTDGRILVDGVWHVLEIKSLGRTTYFPLIAALEAGKFFEKSRSYALQSAVYSHITGLPVFYVVKSRDSGFKKRFQFPAPVPLEDIVDMILEVEVQVLKGDQPKCTLFKGDFWHENCPFSYLHEDDMTLAQVEGGLGLRTPTEMMKEYIVNNGVLKKAKDREAEVRDEMFGYLEARKLTRIAVVDGPKGSFSIIPKSESSKLDTAKIKADMSIDWIAEHSTTSTRQPYVKVAPR